MAVGAFLSFEFGISGKCNTTKVKQPESCPLHARGVVFFPLRTSRGRGVWQSSSDGGNCWPHSAALRRRGRSRRARSSPNAAPHRYITDLEGGSRNAAFPERV